jgi:hypothetical protein
MENIPDVWLSDGKFFLKGVFTKEAILEFRKIYSHLKFSSLRDFKIIEIRKWSLKAHYTNSREYLTSY